MIDRETWRFINSFAPWLSAIGTTAAVILSLYLAQRSARIRLRVSNGFYRMAGEGQKFGDAPRYFQVQAVNHGFREATIQGLMWEYRPLFEKKQKLVTIAPGNPYSSVLPAKISYGDGASFLFTIGEFESGSGPLVGILRNARFPRIAARRLRVGVYTTTGNEVVTPLDQEVRRFLLSRVKEDAA